MFSPEGREETQIFITLIICVSSFYPPPSPAMTVKAPVLGLLVEKSCPWWLSIQPPCWIRNSTAPLSTLGKFSQGGEPAGFFSSEGTLWRRRSSPLHPIFRGSSVEWLFFRKGVWGSQQGFPVPAALRGGTIYWLQQAALPGPCTVWDAC